MADDNVSSAIYGEQPLSEESHAKIRAWLDEHSATELIRCPVCKENSWALPYYLTTMPVIDNSGERSASLGYPVVIVTCNNCAFARMFGAVKIGLMSPDALIEGEVRQDLSNRASQKEEV